MSEMDPHDRINLTGPWAGFGFQGGHMFTPEGHHLDPCDVTWWLWTGHMFIPEGHSLEPWDMTWRLFYLQHCAGMAVGDGRAPAAASSIDDGRKALRRNGFQRRIPARVRQNSQRTAAGHG